MGTNYYQVLGVRNGAHPAEIDLAYKTLSQVSDLDIEAQLELNIAYKTLMHPARRAEFDKNFAPVRAEMEVRTQSAAEAQEQVLRMMADCRHAYAPSAPELSSTNKALTGFLTFYMLGFAAMSIFGLVALII